MPLMVNMMLEQRIRRTTQVGGVFPPLFARAREGCYLEASGSVYNGFQEKLFEADSLQRGIPPYWVGVLGRKDSCCLIPRPA